MRKLLLLISFCSFCMPWVLAQDRTVSGRVTAASDGSPLPGVNVVVKGTSNGTVTNSDGNYTLSFRGPSYSGV